MCNTITLVIALANPQSAFLFNSGPDIVQYCSWARTHDGGDNDGVAQHGGHTPNNRLTETCSLGLLCSSLVLDIHVWSTDTCQNKVSADQYHVTILRAQVNSSSRSSVFLKLTTDQVLLFWLDCRLMLQTCWKQGRIFREAC